MSEEHSDNRFMLGFFIGGLIGALIIFFLGTKEGKRVGKQLEEKGRDLLGDLEDRVGELEEKGKDLVARGEEIKEQVLERVEAKKEELTDSARDNVEQVLARIEELQENGLKATVNLRRRFKNTPKKA